MTSLFLFLGYHLSDVEFQVMTQGSSNPVPILGNDVILGLFQVMTARCPMLADGFLQFLSRCCPIAGELSRNDDKGHPSNLLKEKVFEPHGWNTHTNHIINNTNNSSRSRVGWPRWPIPAPAVVVYYAALAVRPFLKLD